MRHSGRTSAKQHHFNRSRSTNTGSTQPVAFVADSVVVQNATNATVTINVPAGTANGNVMIAFVASDGGSTTTVTPPSGWTQIAANNTTNLASMWAYSRIASSEPASYTWTFGQSAFGNAGSILTYKNASGVDGTASITHGGSGSTSIAAITASKAGEMWVAVGWSPNTAIVPTATGFTGRGAANLVGSGIKDFDQGPQAASGVIGPGTMSVTGNFDILALSCLVKP